MLRTTLSLALVVFATAARAEINLVVSSLPADSSLIAPVLRVYGTNYEYGISGLTADGEWWKGSTVIAADATPSHAHNSNRMYIGHRRDHDSEFENASYRVRFGKRFKNLDVRAVVLYERVSGLPQEIVQRWSQPYPGVEITQTWTNVASRQPLISSFDGIEAAARAEVFAGKRAWSRISLTETAGRTVGRFHFMQSAAVLHGTGLDVVNRFVVGGSWDSMRATAIYGLRYGELRLERALIGSGGVDYRIADNWSVGVRGSFVASDDDDTYGHAINVSKFWKTIGASVGVGKPKAVPGGDGAMVFATLIVPLYKR
jgi:hypothetical protein